MRVATVDGLVTLFYDGSRELYNQGLDREWWDEYDSHNRNREWWEDHYNDGNMDFMEEWNLSDECTEYWRQRQTWQQIIVVEGVTEIPACTFHHCLNIKRVIFSNTVVRVERCAFGYCFNLDYIKLSTNLEDIEILAFTHCDLISVFIPPRCREIRTAAFYSNKNLTIFNVPQNTEMGGNIIAKTKMVRDSHFESDERGLYQGQTAEELCNWLKNMNSDDKYSLHRACASFQPLKKVLLTIVRTKGIGAFTVKNEAGITPFQYLKENPYADVKEMDIVRDYVMKMMGEYN